MSNYRFLKKGEIIKKDDQFLGISGKGTPQKTRSAGDVVCESDALNKCYRRRLHSKIVKPVATAPAASETPTTAPELPKYRFLKAGEKTQRGLDEVLIGSNWAKVVGAKVVGLDGHVVDALDVNRYRRPVKMQDATHRYLDTGETLISGDQVTIIPGDETSGWRGTWANYGTTKVGDIGFSTGKYRRVFPEASAAVVPPKPTTVPEPAYRFLNEGEIASSKTDQWLNVSGSWEDVYGYDGHKVNNHYDKNRFRRKIEAVKAAPEAPKYRFLQHGEIADCKTDQWYSEIRGWEKVDAFHGHTVDDKYDKNCFRRPVTESEPAAEPKKTFSGPDLPKGSFTRQLKGLINKCQLENGSDTPDYILAEYLVDCLKAYNKAVTQRATAGGLKVPAGKDID